MALIGFMISLFPKKQKEEVAPKPSVFLYNTETKSKEIFTPRLENVATLYSCGPTVYDYVHIGNMRSYVFSDTLKRMLVANGYSVRHTINITDFGHLTSDADVGDDKMMSALKREGKEVTVENMLALGIEYTKYFFEDLEKLSIETQLITFPKASEHVEGMVAINKTLEEKGYAYETSDGLYFDTTRFPTYGRLGAVQIEAQKEGARIEVNPEKRNPADFALWKKNPELGWDSPWGKGFPGWHIECTAMIFATLGRQIDIHTGGVDHIAIHHNNELAQAEAATGKRYVHYWMHNEFIKIDGKKISKSLGNTIRLSQIMDAGYNPLAYRYFLHSVHYRSHANFTWEGLDAAQTALYKIQRFFAEELPLRGGEVNKKYWDLFMSAINDDLDTPKALATLWELIKESEIDKKDKRATLVEMDKVLGLGLNAGKKKLKEKLSLNVVSLTALDTEIQDLIEEREKARMERAWEKADEIRSELLSKGYEVTDNEKGTEIKKLPNNSVGANT